MQLQENPRGTAVVVKNGTYTVHNRATDGHRTFRINTATRGALKGKRIVALLTGPDNENAYTGFGFVDDHGIKVWQKFRDQGDWQKYADILWSLAFEGELSRFAKNARLMFSGTCCRCNRKLTVPSSIESGIGPECAKIHRQDHPF